MREVDSFQRNIMISTILVGNKQFSVQLGSRLKVEKLSLKQGEIWLGKQVMAIQKDNGEAVFGEPFISKAQVKAKVVRHGKAKKVLILKKHRRKGYRRTLGHRQQFTEIYVTALSDSTGQWTAEQPKKRSQTKVQAKPQKKLQKKQNSRYKKRQKIKKR